MWFFVIVNLSITHTHTHTHTHTTIMSSKRRKEEDFFQTSSEPNDLHDIRDRLHAFTTAQVTTQKIIVLSSGGTTVPLEKRTVRFLDNFSTGARGAAMCEEFLRKGDCSVIFLHRKGSLMPFTSQASSKTLDLNFVLACARDDGPGEAFMKEAREVKHLVENNRFICVPFESVGEYLHKLKACCETIKVRKRSMVILAAAVSDFYVPEEQMAEHKIQSSQGGFDLHLEPVPKMLGRIKREFAPNSIIVSFKLETDEGLLISKSCKAIENYGVHVVVANKLDTRYNEVLLVEGLSTNPKITKINKGSLRIESPLVHALLLRFVIV